jgi:hypothetical protein
VAASYDNPHFVFVGSGLHTDWGSSILNWLYPVEGVFGLVLGVLVSNHADQMLISYIVLLLN